MNVPHGATHRKVGTDNYYMVTDDRCFYHDGIDWGQCLTIRDFSGLVMVVKPQTLQERLTAILGVETDEDIVVHVKALHDAAQEQETQLSELHDITTALCDAGVLKEGKVIDAVKSLLGQETEYWDGVEPLRVGHIVAQGEIVAKKYNHVCVQNPYELLLLLDAIELTPHPLTTLSDSERELVNNLIEAGVVCLPS